MSEYVKFIKSLLKWIQDVETQSGPGRINLFFGTITTFLFLVAFVASILDTVLKFIETILGRAQEGQWNTWVPLIAFSMCIMLFGLSVVTVAYFGRKSPPS